MLKIFHVRTVPKSNLKVVGTEVKPLPLTWKQASSAPVEKTVRHQDISVPLKKVSNRHRIIFQTNVITFLKIKSMIV